jgi:RNA polymerase sigma-70 factor, ECF subfamily
MYFLSNSAKEDEMLAKAARKANLDAFNQLVLKYENLAYHHACFLLGDPVLAEDATQESFIKAFQNINAFRGGSFRSWLLRILTNTVYDLLRKNKMQRSVPLFPEDNNGNEMESAGWLVDPGMPIHESIEQKELAANLVEILNELPEGYRSVIILVDVYEMDYLEAAGVLDIPLGTVKSRVARARQQLKEKLERSLRLPQPVESSKFEFTVSV